MSADGLFTQERYPDSRNPRSVQDGLEFQDHCMGWLLSSMGILLQVNTSTRYQLEQGESRQQVEIKLDRRCTETGHLSIEIAERSAVKVAVWTPSGIYSKTMPVFYAQGNYTVLYLFNTKDLLDFHRGRLHGAYYELETIRKFHLPLRDAEQLCIRKGIAPNPREQYRIEFPIRR